MKTNPLAMNDAVTFSDMIHGLAEYLDLHGIAIPRGGCTVEEFQREHECGDYLLLSRATGGPACVTAICDGRMTNATPRLLRQSVFGVQQVFAKESPGSLIPAADSELLNKNLRR
jgi:hypothetical protein